MDAELPASTVIGAPTCSSGSGTSRLCFVYDKSHDKLLAHVLNSSILGIQLV